MRPGDIERRYKQRLRELWAREEVVRPVTPPRVDAPDTRAIPRLRRLSAGRPARAPEGLVEEAEQVLADAGRKARRLVARAEEERAGMLARERARGVMLRFKMEDRLRVLEQRVEEAARQRGRARGVAEATRQVGALFAQAEELLVELTDARTRQRTRAREEAVEMAVGMAAALLKILPERIPAEVTAALGAWAEAESERLGGDLVLRVHPSRRESFSALEAVRSGRLRLELDPASPPGRVRVLGRSGAADRDPERGLAELARSLRSLLPAPSA